MKISVLNKKHAWSVIAYYIIKNKSFKSISGIKYSANISDHSISYKGDNRNNGEEEIILKEEFTQAFEAIQSMDDINTNTIKAVIPNSLYRKRTPFIGLLFSSEIIQ
jgi:hypothetical protein